MVVIIDLSFAVLPFLSDSVSELIEMGALRNRWLDRFRHRCIDLDPESTQHRQCAVERLKPFAGLDAGQTTPVEAQLEPIDQLLLSKPVRRARVAQRPAEICTGANPIVLCAHIDTGYPVR